MKLAAVAVAAISFGLASPRVADAFCGFYVAGGDQKMFNDATQVVLMRKGTRTVLSMQNNYAGPPEAFALVVPVPVVLHEGDVKTLSKDVFAHVEQMGAPRLVEYWEQDPCHEEPPVEYSMMPAPTATAVESKSANDKGGLGVTIEAKFTVGEYQILILSAKDSTGLETWLRQEKYTIPAGAEPLLRPYVESGSKFFVAKVDPAKVKFENGRAALSPLRFHYDSEEFSLPIRLGLASSSGTQDLIVNILAPNQRYDVANYDNVTIPTNITISEQIKDKFGGFYTALFDRTLEKHPHAVVTEYAWQATTCDPCPGPALDQGDFLTLGADVIDSQGTYNNADFVLTRLHARYGKDLSDDLRFKQAEAIVGGRELVQSGGQLEEGAQKSTFNNFQGRYAIRHPWTGPLTCDNPKRGRWGGPPAGVQAPIAGALAATNLAFAPRGGVQLAAAVLQDVPEIDLHAGAAPGATASGARPGSAIVAGRTKNKSGCGCATTEGDVLGGALVIGAVLVQRRRRRPRGA